MRKPISTSKPYLRQEYKICSTFKLSLIDVCHLLPYGLFSIILPNLPDKLGGRISLFIVFLGSGISLFLIYIFDQIVDSKVNNNLSFYLIALAIFFGGTFQAFAWPSVIKGMSEHIPSQIRTTYLPIWTTCCSFGSMTAGFIIGVIYLKLEDGRITVLGTSLGFLEGGLF